MNNYDSRIELINQQAEALTSVFFSAENLLKNIR
jgi:hypothetical protein